MQFHLVLLKDFTDFFAPVDFLKFYPWSYRPKVLLSILKISLLPRMIRWFHIWYSNKKVLSCGIQ